MALVLDVSTPTARTVCNLEWLLRHWQEVQGFEFAEPTDDGYWDLLRAACTALRDYSENDVTLANLEDGRVTVERIVGYGVRSSMPGYLDCTPWSVYTPKREATKAYHAERRENAGEDA